MQMEPILMATIKLINGPMGKIKSILIPRNKNEKSQKYFILHAGKYFEFEVL